MSEQGESGKSKQRLAWATGNMALSGTEMGKAMGKTGLAGDGERRSEVQFEPDMLRCRRHIQVRCSVCSWEYRYGFESEVWAEIVLICLTHFQKSSE